MAALNFPHPILILWFCSSVSPFLISWLSHIPWELLLGFQKHDEVPFFIFHRSHSFVSSTIALGQWRAWAHHFRILPSAFLWRVSLAGCQGIELVTSVVHEVPVEAWRQLWITCPIALTPLPFFKLSLSNLKILNPYLYLNIPRRLLGKFFSFFFLLYQQKMAYQQLSLSHSPASTILHCTLWYEDVMPGAAAANLQPWGK